MYQNVPQDMNFHIFDVNKKITLAKFGGLINYVQPRDEKNKHFWNGGWGRLTYKNLTSNQSTHMRYHLKADILLILI